MSTAVAFPPTASRTQLPQLGSPTVAPVTRLTPASPLYSVATVTQSPLSPSYITDTIVRNNPELAQLRRAIVKPNLSGEMKEPEIDYDFTRLSFQLGPARSARENEKNAQKVLAETQYLSRRDELFRDGLRFLFDGVRNRMQQQEKVALLRVYDREIKGLRAQVAAGVSTIVPLRLLQRERHEVQKQLTGLRAAGQKITQNLATVMGVELENIRWPTLMRAADSYLTVVSPVKTSTKPRTVLSDLASISAHYRRESELMSQVPLKRGGFVWPQPGTNLSYTQSSDLAQRMDVPRQILVLQNVMARPNPRFDLTQVFPELWAQARGAPAAKDNNLLASAGARFPSGTVPTSAAASAADRTRFARLLVEQARQNPAEIVAELWKRGVPFAVTEGGGASITTLKPTEVANIDRQRIAQDLDRLNRDGKGGTQGAQQRALILASFARLDAIEAKGKGFKFSIGLDQIIPSLVGGAPLGLASLFLKTVQANFLSGREQRLQAAEGKDVVVDVILTTLATGRKGLQEIHGLVKPLVQGEATQQRRADLIQQLQMDQTTLASMKNDTKLGIYNPLLKHNDYGINMFRAERNVISSQYALRLDSLEPGDTDSNQPGSILYELLNLHRWIGRISSNKFEDYLERHVGFPPAGVRR